MNPYWGDPRAEAFAQQLRIFLDGDSNWYYNATARGLESGRPAATVLADQLVDAIGFRELQLATLLETPDAHLVETVVQQVLPWQAGDAFQLLLEAIHLAAAAEQRRQRGQVGAWTAVAAAAFIGVIVLIRRAS